MKKCIESRPGFHGMETMEKSGRHKGKCITIPDPSIVPRKTEQIDETEKKSS